MRRFAVLLTLAWALAASSYAACSNPVGQAGSMQFNTNFKTMQYCNDTNWINAGPAIATASQSGCTSPAGLAGNVLYNSSRGVVQFCNGSSWIDTACARDRTTGGSGCASPSGQTGQIQYSSTANELQFCDSTNWVAMGWPCAAINYPSATQVFATTLYTGNGSTQAINNGINLSGNGGMVMTKDRGSTNWWNLFSSGITGILVPHEVDTEWTGDPSRLTFTSTGFNLGSSSGDTNGSAHNYAAFNFRKAPRFFDVVAYTGSGITKVIPHNLGVTPGMIFVKRLNLGTEWMVYHRSLTAAGYYLKLNATNAQANANGNIFGNGSIGVLPTSSNFTVGGNQEVNTSGQPYIAYLFAHDPDPNGIIQCGSYTSNGAGTATVSNLPWEPQYLISKRTDSTADWEIIDTTRGWGPGNDQGIYPNQTYAEGAASRGQPTATGFDAGARAASASYIYCAIRKP